jgi:arginase
MPNVRLIGLPTDINSSFLRGPAKAPEHIRRALFSDHANMATERGPELGTDIKLEDAGDLPLDESEGDDARIEAVVRLACEEGATPILLGGDHAVTYPVLRGIAAVHGPVNILHFDAHPDLYDMFDGNRRSHASPFARIMEEGLTTRLVQVGIRTLNAHCRAQAARFGVEIVPMRDFAASAVPIPPAPLYISIDLDGLDPAYAPGVSHPEPGGLSVRQVLDVLARVPGPIVGADVVELNPDRDVNGATAVVAAKLVKELCGLCSSPQR